ncbi:MAG: hypothetical protein R3C32_04480 [Chloroflexota bacterium]
MSSTTRLGPILASVALTALFAGQASAQSPGMASVDPLQPAWVTGTLHLGSCNDPTSAMVEGVYQERGYVCEGQEWRHPTRVSAARPSRPGTPMSTTCPAVRSRCAPAPTR